MKSKQLGMRYNLQFFGEDDVPPVADPPTDPQPLDAAGLDSLLDSATPPAETPPVAPTVTDSTVPPVETPPPVVDKTNHAFAEMRTQNAAMAKLLGSVAQAAGIEYTNAQDLMAKLNDDTIGKLAVKQGVPKELLERMQLLETQSQLYQQQQLKDSALTGFQSLQTKYGLSQEDLNKFAVELDEAELNPFVKEVDLNKEYLARHYENAMQKAIDAAVEAALKKNQQSSNSSTTPNTVSGTGDGTTPPVTTVAGLNALLDSK